MTILGHLGDAVNYVPLLMTGQVRKRVSDDNYEGVLLRKADVMKGWQVMVAAIAPLAAALWWIDGRIETHIGRALTNHQAIIGVQLQEMERRGVNLESFQSRGGRFTESDGKELRKEFMGLMLDHERRIDNLEQPGSDNRGR